MDQDDAQDLETGFSRRSTWSTEVRGELVRVASLSVEPPCWLVQLRPLLTCLLAQEDAKLVHLVQTYGPCNWSLIAQVRLRRWLRAVVALSSLAT